jgi:hypothetical protein
VVLPTRAPRVNLRPSPAATSRTERTCARGRRTRFGDRRTTAITRSSRSRRTASMGNRIPNVCTDRECSSRSPSFGSSPDRPRSPRPRSRRVSGIHTSHGPKRTRRTTGSLAGRPDISARRDQPTVDGPRVQRMWWNLGKTHRNRLSPGLLHQQSGSHPHV